MPGIGRLQITTILRGYCHTVILGLLMAYVEVWKSGRLITRRRVDEEKARKGCKVRLGPAGEVRVALCESETLGQFEVRDSIQLSYGRTNV